MKFIIGLFLFCTFLLVAYTPLREIIFFTGEVAIKESGTWQEIYNCILGCGLFYIHVKGFGMLFKSINQTGPFRMVMGLFLLGIFGLLALNEFSKEFLFFRNPENFSEIAINASWSFIGIYSFIKGLYCVWAGNKHIPGVDDGNWKFTWKGFIEECNAPIETSNCINKNIQNVLDYRNSMVTMMPNDKAIAELSKTAGIELYLNNNSSYAQYLDSKLAMKSNEEGYKYVQNLFKNK